MLGCLEKRVYGVQLALVAVALPPPWAAVCPLVAWQPLFVIFSPVTSIERALLKSNSRSISASNRAVSPELAVHPAVLFVIDWSERAAFSFQ